MESKITVAAMNGGGLFAAVGQPLAGGWRSGRWWWTFGGYGLALSPQSSLDKGVIDLMITFMALSSIMSVHQPSSLNHFPHTML